MGLKNEKKTHKENTTVRNNNIIYGIFERWLHDEDMSECVISSGTEMCTSLLNNVYKYQNAECLIFFFYFFYKT